MESSQGAAPPANASTATFVAKAKRYVSRATAHGAQSEEHAFWLHMAVEPLLRAAVAQVNPVLLAEPRDDAAVLAALGVGARREISRSRKSSNLVALLARVDAHRFGPDFARRSNALLERRNVECHSGVAAFANPRGSWRDDFLRVALTICGFLAIEPDDLLGEGLARIANDLSERDEREVEAEVRRLIAAASAKPSPVPESERKFAAIAGVEEAQFTNGLVAHAVSCPACGNPAFVSGWPVHSGDPALVGADLVRTLTVASQAFACDYCGLSLANRPLVAAAGLPDVFETTQYVDPYETLSLDPREEIERMGLEVIDPSWEPDFDDLHD
jgi:hypothetical protein